MKKTIFGLNALLVLFLLTTACAPAAAPAPTIDANQLFTQAAITVIAQLTKNAPTATQIPTQTKAPLFTNTPPGGALPTLPPLATLPAFATPTRAGLNIADKALYLTQSPADGASVKTGQIFNVTWRLRNVGTTTWNQNYKYRFFAAANKLSTNAGEYALTKTVPPNGEVDLTVVATAPSSVGTVDTQWVITNPEGTNFQLFTLTVNVVAGSSSNPGATAVPVPGNACEDTGTISGPGVIAAPGSGSIDVPGGEMWVYYKLDSGTTAAALGVGAPAAIGDNHKGVSVTSTSEAVVKVGQPSKDPVKLFYEVATAAVNITKIKYWKSNSSCY
jgi:hypothetical protein